MHIRFDSCRIVSLLLPPVFITRYRMRAAPVTCRIWSYDRYQLHIIPRKNANVFKAPAYENKLGDWVDWIWKTLRTSRHILATVPDLTYVYMYISCTMMEVSQRLIYSRSLNSNLTDIFNFLTNFSVKESPSKKCNGKQHSQAFPWQTEWNSWTSKLPGYVCVQRSLHYRRLWFNRQQKFPTRSHSLTNDDRQKRR